MRTAQFERTVETAVVGAYSKGGATRTRCSHIYDGFGAFFENPEGGGAEFWARATAFETVSRGVEINCSAAQIDSFWQVQEERHVSLLAFWHEAEICLRAQMYCRWLCKTRGTGFSR
jgi:hypothetical protein